MMKTIEFVTTLFCKYAVEGDDGLTSLTGIYPGLGLFHSALEFPRYMALIVRPKVRSSDFVIDVRGPTRGMKNTVGFESNDSMPDESDRLVFVVPIWRIGSTPGTYNVFVGETGDELTRLLSFDLRIEPPEKRPESAPKPKSKGKQR